MDLHAVHLRGGCSGGIGCLWASKRKLPVIDTGRCRDLSPTYRLVRVRAAGRRGNSSSSGSNKNNNRNNGDHDPASGNDPYSLGMDDYEDQTDPVFGKSRRGTSKVTNLDWRNFRAKLVAQEQMKEEDSNVRENQMSRHNSSRRLSSKWAHPLSMLETGCILVATDKLDGVPDFERSVILLLKTSMTGPTRGPFGVVLNRPLQHKTKHLKAIDADLAKVFSRCSIHFGGPLDDSMFLLRTGGFLQMQCFEQVIPGIYFGRRNSIHQAAELIEEGVVRPQDIRFFLGYAGWQLDQLRHEIESGYWVVAACGVDLIKRTSPVSSSGLWEEILQLMGGPYAELSKKPRQEDP